jgi:hypothetical protein
MVECHKRIFQMLEEAKAKSSIKPETPFETLVGIIQDEFNYIT